MYQDVVKDLQDFMELSGKSQQQVAKEAALSPAVISQFLKGTYKGNNEETAATIQKYLELARLRMARKDHTHFYKDMHNTQKVLLACYHAHRYGDIALVYGDAGAGKTKALNHYAGDHPGVVMVTANSCTSSAFSVLQMIGRKTGKTLAGKKEILMAALVDYFKNTGRLIIIDESDHLTMAALQAVRNLNDQAGVGIILAGNSRIYTQMLQGAKCSELEQLRTRIVLRRRVTNEYTLEEFREMFPDVPESCYPYLIQLAADESLRSVNKLLDLAYSFTDQIDLNTLQMVRIQLTEEF